MKKTSVLKVALVLFYVLVVVQPVSAAERLRMATTTSTENSGLLDQLLPPFEELYDCQVAVIAVGTGKALKIAESGDVDIVLVHARALEDAFVAAGYGVNRHDVMYNDFVILGPVDDPADAAQAFSAAEALAVIADAQSPFVSRGDESGTHQKEKQLWEQADISPEGQWYIESGRGMGEVIVMATQKDGYTLADRGTYIAFKKEKTDLEIVFEGDDGLFNPYGVIAVNPQKHPHVKYDLAMKFVEFITGPAGQEIIDDFKIDGEQVFFPMNLSR
ncbi:MAG: substrate-binding domain-containing protein [Geoalkalibacter sp.]|jgi:tungstate transport system substrate-binding protein|uniref:substrate-binding domain-containing protein n=1 Tax=Geoalkalibacter sp. TaxID=3041440 RepID=UPI003D148CB8